MWAVGSKLGRFQLERELGQGAHGVVFAARDTTLDTPVAIKVLHEWLAQDPAVRARFKRELLLARRIAHPGICKLFDLHEDSGAVFLSMELVQGPTLLDVLKTHGRFHSAQGIALLRGVAHALTAAHAVGVIHRDLKPANIVVRPDGGPVILDFGTAIADDMSRVTRTGTAVGSIRFIAPEIFGGAAPSVVTDVYSLGVVAYAMFAGKLPFASVAGAFAMMEVIKTQPPARINTLHAEISAQLADVVARGMAREPAERYQTALEFEAALLATQEATHVNAPPPAAPPASPDFSRWASPSALQGAAVAPADVSWPAASPTAMVAQPTLRVMNSVTLGSMPSVVPSVPWSPSFGDGGQTASSEDAAITAVAMAADEPSVDAFVNGDVDDAFAAPTSPQLPRAISSLASAAGAARADVTRLVAQSDLDNEALPDFGAPRRRLLAAGGAALLVGALLVFWLTRTPADTDATDVRADAGRASIAAVEPVVPSVVPSVVLSVVLSVVPSVDAGATAAMTTTAAAPVSRVAHAAAKPHPDATVAVLDRNVVAGSDRADAGVEVAVVVAADSNDDFEFDDNAIVDVAPAAKRVAARSPADEAIRATKDAMIKKGLISGDLMEAELALKRAWTLRHSDPTEAIAVANSARGLVEAQAINRAFVLKKLGRFNIRYERAKQRNAAVADRVEPLSRAALEALNAGDFPLMNAGLNRAFAAVGK